MSKGRWVEICINQNGYKMKAGKELLVQNVGVDVSKDTMNVVLSTMDTRREIKIKGSRKFSNTVQGFREFVKWLEAKHTKSCELRVLMEATGIYYEQFAWYLHERKFTVSVVLPTKAKRYLQAIGNKSKNDKIDAKGLSRMGLEQNLPQWLPLSKNIYRLRLLTRQLEDFNNQRTVFLNQLHALGHSAYAVKEVEKNLNKLIRELEKGIEKIDRAIEKLIREDEKLTARVDKIKKIKGVGIKTIAVLLAETNGFETFENQGQLVSYSGYDIVENQSGKFNGKTKMSKKGNAHIRRAMHLPAFGVVRYQQGPFKAFYDRLISKGKTKMQAYVAVQRKLLVLIWALWKKDQEYNPDYHLTQFEYSGNDESKPLFSHGSGGDNKKVGPESTSPTVDELPCNESPEALFSQL